MAKTKDGKKIVTVAEHERSKPKVGKTSVKGHRRSTPNTPYKTEKKGFFAALFSLFRR